MGVEVITVTSNQIYSTNEFARTARQLAGQMDRRLRSNESPGFAKAHQELRHMLGL